MKLQNADVSSGKIEPVKKPVILSYNDPVRYGHYGSANRSVVKWYNRFYWSNNNAVTAPFYGGNIENYLGIPYPAYSGTGANVSIAADTSAVGENGLTGSYHYCVTFVNANGWEGAPGSLEEYEVPLELEDQTGKIIVTWSDERIAYAKVYRTISHGADFYCVGEIHDSGGLFRDTVPDSSAQLMNPLTTQYAYPPPERGKYLTEYGGVFFLAVGEKLYFSSQGNPHAWPTTQFVSIDDTITGIVPEFQGVLVFTVNKVFRIIGAESEATIVKSYIPGNHGCPNYHSIATLNNAPVWLSADGICSWDGSNITIPSYQVIHTENLAVRCAVSAEDRYYLFLTSGTLVFDRKNGDVFYTLDFTCQYAWYDGDTDILFLQNNNHIYQYGEGENLTAEYLSPDIGGGDTAIKIFREMVVAVSAPAQISVSCDGGQIAELNVAAPRERIKLPRNAVGRTLSVKIRTAGRINELTVVYE